MMERDSWFDREDDLTGRIAADVSASEIDD
jgi:hypothetical protein